MIDLIIIGAGGHAKVCASVAEAQGKFRVIGFTEVYGATALASPVLGDDSTLAEQYQSGQRHAFVGIGNNAVRLRLAQDLRAAGWSLPTLIHPSAVVDTKATIGDGTLIGPGAIVNVDATIGFSCIINTGASVDHDCVVEDGCHVAPGARLCGTVTLGTASMIGAGAVVIPEIQVGQGATVGAGASVVANVEQGSVVVGVPAKARPQSGLQ